MYVTHQAVCVSHGVEYVSLILTLVYDSSHLHWVGHVRVKASQVTTGQEWYNDPVLTSQAVQHTW